MDNYVIYHLHSDLSNGVTNVDSVNKFGDYIEAAKNYGMKAMAFSEHGSLFKWWHKKSAIEAAGMKYIHAVEAYVTESLDEKVRDNYHCVLIARNHDGFIELNRLISKSFNRKDNHFYYVPRISLQELYGTSDNIIITSACVGGILGKGNERIKNSLIIFFVQNSDRCFLEIGHHIDEKQKKYNEYLYDLSKKHNLRLIAGTDTHVLNERYEKGRSILQKSKKIHFEGEENWNLKFLSFDELCSEYAKQNVLPKDVYLDAIDMTNTLADMISPFEVDRNTKYPHIYSNPEETFYNKAIESIDKHPYALKNHTREELVNVVNEEFEVYKATKSIDFMLLQTLLREWEKEQGIQCGYGRGSVSGSMIAYLLGITQMDSMRFGLNFFRFLNPSRVTNADIDTDYCEADRDKVKTFLLRDKLNLDSIRSAEIITFNTIAMKGAIRDVVRALYSDDEKVNYMALSSEICSLAERDEEEAREKYPEVFEYVDIINGTIVSIGTHPSGVLIADLPLDEVVGLCSLGTTEYPVSMIDMKELDDLMFVKLDILGLDNIGIINDTCKMLGIERITPDNVDLDDENVWKSIRDDTTMIFQWESPSAQKYLRKFMSDRTLEIAEKRIPNFSKIKWMSFGNGLIRPACASFRENVANGEFYDNGFDALNEFLAPEAGKIAMQETIMQFLVKFCGYSAAESDTVRRAIAKKKGTETLLPEIRDRFVNYTTENYGLTTEKAESVIEAFLQIILDASAYAFSWNHSDAYSCIGYISGYLRYYHPYEFIVSALNTFSDNPEKTVSITNYASRHKIKISTPKWGISRGNYYFNKNRKVITKGLASIKYIGNDLAEEMFDIANKRRYDLFIDVLKELDSCTSINRRQLEILTKIDFFSDFGNQREIMQITSLYYDMFKRGCAKKVSKSKVDGTPIGEIIKKYAVGVTKSGGVASSYTLLDVDSILRDAEIEIKRSGIEDFDDITKVKNFAEHMGYTGYVSGNNEDRRKLYVLNVFPCRKRSTGEMFGRTVFTKSIGSGIESKFTIINNIYDKKPVKQGDIIYCKKYEVDGKYFRMIEYDIL